MRHLGTQIVALRAANVRSFIRPNDGYVMCATLGRHSQTQPSSGWSKPD
jgi:hypothetical protein